MSYSMANHVKFIEIEICTNVVLVETILVEENGKTYSSIFYSFFISSKTRGPFNFTKIK